VSTAVIALLIPQPLVALFVLSVSRYSSSKVFLALALLIGFYSVFLLATTVGFTVIIATKSAKVSASLDGVPVPQSIINDVAKSIGLTPVYKDFWYSKCDDLHFNARKTDRCLVLVRVAAIVPWFACFFAFTASALMLHHWLALKKEAEKGLTQNLAEEHESDFKEELSPT
jgi:hypothetical protein